MLLCTVARVPHRFGVYPDASHNQRSVWYAVPDAALQGVLRPAGRSGQSARRPARAARSAVAAGRRGFLSTAARSAELAIRSASATRTRIAASTARSPLGFDYRRAATVVLPTVALLLVPVMSFLVPTGFGLATLGSLQQEVRRRQEEPHEAHPCFAKIRRQATFHLRHVSSYVPEARF